MANRRMISKSISISKKLAKASPFAALLFTWTIAHCDDGGNTVGDPFTLKGLVIPVRPETVEQVHEAKQELIDLKLWTEYIVSDEQFIHVLKWEEHQTLRKDRATFDYPGYPDGNQSATNRQPLTAEGKVREGKVSIYPATLPSSRDGFSKSSISGQSPTVAPPIPPTPPEAIDLAKILLSYCQKNNPKFIFKNSIESWAKDIDKLHRIDQQTWEDINRVIVFSQNDSFWKMNILSAKTLRDKYNQLAAKLFQNFVAHPASEEPDNRRVLTA